MPAAREGADLIWYLTGRWPNGRWRGWDLLGRRVWRNRYLLHDTFGKRWNRYVVCPLYGHGDIKDIADPGQPQELHCFDCEVTLT